MKEWIQKYLPPKTIYLLLFLSGVYGTMSAFLDHYQLPRTTLILLITLAGSILFASLTFIPSKVRRWIWLGIFAIWLIIGIQYWRQIAWGLYRCWIYLLPTLRQHFPVKNPGLPPLTLRGEYIAMGSFLFLLLPYLALLCWAVIGRKSFWLSILLTAPIVIFSWNIQKAVPTLSLLFSLLFWIAMALQSGISRAVRPQTAQPLRCILIISLAAAVLICAVSPQAYQPWSYAPALREKIDTAVSDIGQNFDGIFGGSVFSSGKSLANNRAETNLDRVWREQAYDQDVLRVYSENPATLYLRGYSSSVYTGNYWRQPERERYPEEGFGFDPLAYLSEQNLKEGTPSEIIVEPLVSNARYLFTPYLLTEISADPVPRWERDAYLSGRKQQRYCFQSLAPTEQKYLISGDNSPIWYPHFTPQKMFSYTFPYDGRQYYFTSLSGYGPWTDKNADSSNRIEATYLMSSFYNPPKDLDTFSAFYSPEEQDWEYMRYIMKEYTQLPDGLRDVMLDWWNSVYSPAEGSRLAELYTIQDASRGNVPYWKWASAAGLVAREIRDAGTYTTSPDPHPLDRDFVEYFLTEGKEGDCVYFASATAVMLRTLGIPARYVEGYVVEQSRFGADGWATVPGKNAHAWAEIWIPGTGWIPVEATPGGMSAAPLTEDVTAEPSLEPEFSPEPTPEFSAEPSESPSPEPSETSAPETPTPSAHDKTTDPSMDVEESGLPPAVLCLILTLILAVLPFLIRYLAIRRRSRLFFQDNPNRAALEIYRTLLYLQRYSGSAESEAATTIALKARFSTHKISAEELKTLMREYHLSRATARANMPRRLRLLYWMEGF